MSTMAVAPPCDGVDADWFHVLGDFNLLLCSSTSPRAAMASSRPEDSLPMIAAAAPPGPGGHRSCCKNEVLEASSNAAFAAADCLSSALMNLQREDESFCMPMYSAPPPPAVVGDQYSSGQLPPLPPDLSLDDALLLPFSDIDLEAFDNNAADEHKPPPADQMIMIPPAVHHHHHHPAAAGTRSQPFHAHHEKAMADTEDFCFRRAGGIGVEMAVVVRHHDDDERPQAGLAVPQPPPPSLPRPRARRSGGGRSSPPAGKARLDLDHIGFDELRKYFYMPITKAAREMNVGLTVLKKRCRELGIARWPHRKMKSLKSLMANVQEMGTGMSPAVAVQQELAALETYCTLMEENPWIELTDRTKKLRQAYFKESYKRRRAAKVSFMEMDHVYSFGQQHQLPPPPTSSADDDDRHDQQSSHFFGY